MLQQSLARLGLKDKEVTVFSTLLELGPQSAGVVARFTGLTRGTTYLILDTLVTQGLVSRIEKSGVLSYAAMTPEDLLKMVRAKKRELDYQEQEIENILPHLNMMMKKHMVRPKVRYFEGEDGVKAVMNETLTSKETILSYANMDAWKNSSHLHDFIRGYCYRRSFEAKIPLKCLMYDTPTAREHFSTGHANFEINFIPKEVVFESSIINIFDDKIVMVSLEAGNLCGIIIESQEIASTQKAIFELAWRGCDPKCLAINR